MSLSNNSSSENRIKSKGQSSTKGNSNSYSTTQRKASFLSSTIFRQEMTLNDKNNRCALQFVLDELKIETIRNGPTFIEVNVHQHKNGLKKENMKDNSILGQGSQQVKEYVEMDAKLTNRFEEFKVKMQNNPNEYAYNTYLSWLKEMQHKNFISWFMPIRQNSTQIKSISISHKTLALMGYSPQQAALSLSEYKSNCLNFLSNEAYYQFYWTYINSFSKFVQSQLDGNFRNADVVQQSENVIVNQLIGKNQRRIKTQMKIWMPSPFIMCMQMMTIAKGQKIYDPSLELTRKQIEQRYSSDLITSLGHIYEFPKPKIVQKKMTICSYVVIDNFLQ